MATYKDGHTETFETLKDASLKTGISETSIKIRCNKHGCGGKDKTLFEWLDPHTKRSYQAKKSRSKGSALEYHVCEKLKEIGYEGMTTSRSESKTMDNGKIDLVDSNKELPLNIQCKHTQNLPNYFTIKEACIDQTLPFCMIWKKATSDSTNSPGTVAIIPEDFLYELLSVYKNEKIKNRT